MHKVNFILMLTLFFYAAQSHAVKPKAPENVEGTKIVTAAEVIDLILANPEIIIVDSRRNTEYKKGHIEGSKNILDVEMTQENLYSIIPDLNQQLIFYCNGPRCLRSSHAASKAVSWGYKHVFWFKGGWSEWKKNNFPIAIDNE
ncbi:MAG: rhodanese-like domain-containing protein [Gammaproteobacteria bacterium]|nr:rhodanese-like domain-containing protein [Gammaproteobacteria bacterium]